MKRIIIRVETDEQADAILAVLTEAEEDGVLDFAFGTETVVDALAAPSDAHAELVAVVDEIDRCYSSPMSADFVAESVQRLARAARDKLGRAEHAACIVCGKPARPYSSHCSACLAKLPKEGASDTQAPWRASDEYNGR